MFNNIEERLSYFKFKIYNIKLKTYFCFSSIINCIQFLKFFKGLFNKNFLVSEIYQYMSSNR